MADLRTIEGREIALASIVQRIRSGYLTRDEVSALTLEKHCILGIGSLRDRRELPEKLADAEAALLEAKQAIAGKAGASSLRASSAPTPPLEANELGPDVAHPAPSPRDGEPDQP